MCKKAEPIEMPFEGADSCGPKKPCITRGLDPTERISVMGVSHGIKSRRVQRWMQLQRWVCDAASVSLLCTLVSYCCCLTGMQKNRLLVCPCCLKCVTVKDLYCQTYVT